MRGLYTKVHRRPRNGNAAAHAASVMLLAAILLAAAAMTGPAEVSVTDTRRVRVRPGDSLWKIAREYAPAGVSTAATVEAIASLNGIEGGRLNAGSSIFVPASVDSDRVAMR